MALTALDFPASPTVGQVYPDPPVTGQPQYSWNGTQWISSKAAVTQIARTDALGWSGMQINGSMEVSQENGGSVLTVSNAVKYLVDGWFMYSSGTQSMSVAQLTFGSVPPSGFANSLSAQAGTANAAPAATHQVVLVHRIEGYRIARLAWGLAGAQPITLAFWVFAIRPGTYSGSIQNGSTNRSYVFTFSVNATGTWEYKAITVPGDTTGTWNIDNTTGLQITFAMMAGTSLCTAPSTWTAGDFRGATGTINGVAATSDIFRITGLVVLPGIEAPTAAQSPLIMRPFDQELLTCMRYFEAWTNVGGGGFNIVATGWAATGNTVDTAFFYKCVKRVSPTLSVTAPGDFVLLNSTGGAASGCNSVSALYAGPHTMTLRATMAASTFTPGQIASIATNNSQTAKIFLDARL